MSPENPLPLNLHQPVPQPLMAPILDWGLLEVRGPDAVKFIQGQATCDMRRLEELGQLSGAFCNPKGRVLATFRLFAAKESIFLRMPRDLIMRTQSALQRYAAFFDIKLHYAHELVGLALLSGQPVAIETAELDVLGSMPQANSAEFWGTPEQIKNLQKVFQDKCLPASPEWWEASLIQSGEAQVFALTSEQFLAHQLSLDLSGAISFRKGCYTGQEIIARTQYRGKSKKRLATAKLIHRENFFPGTEIVGLDSSPLGHLLLAVSDADSTLIQAVLPDDVASEGEFVLGTHKTRYTILPTTFSEPIK